VLPNFFVIGAAKCGTTSLAAYLAQHPEIHVSPVKEPRFFARAESGHPFPGRRVGSRAEYEALFDSDAPARGEASAAYSQHPRRAGVAARIRELIPDARFIYLVGDPIRRVESHYVQTVAEEGEERPIAEVLGNIEDPCHPAICPGRYAQQLHQYLSLFPEDQLLVIDRDELLEHRGPTLSEVFAFLGVDPDYESAAFAQTHNRSADHRNISSGLYGRLRRGPLRAAIRAVPPSLREPVLRRLRQALADEVSRPLLERSLRARLEAEFAPEVTRLRELTGKRFAGWSI
jgi:Sulfotransferase domain